MIGMKGAIQYAKEFSVEKVWLPLGNLFVFSNQHYWPLGVCLVRVPKRAGSARPADKCIRILVEVSRGTFENWQSEFLQLIWQVAGLALLLYVGSPQSKEGDDRKEAKIDAILEAVNPKDASEIIKKLDQQYQKG